MTDQFAPFPTGNGPVNPLTNFGEQTPLEVTKKTRGPRRPAVQVTTNIKPGIATGYTYGKKMGRSKKEAAQAPALSSLFQILAGLQSSDVVPLTSCYETLAALPPEDRARVLGMLNRVWG